MYVVEPLSPKGEWYAGRVKTDRADNNLFALNLKKKGDNPLSILKLNNKIITLGGSVVTAIDYPVKGELINMDLDGNGNKTYRVLKADNTTAECLAMYECNTSTILALLRCTLDPH